MSTPICHGTQRLSAEAATLAHWTEPIWKTVNDLFKRYTFFRTRLFILRRVKTGPNSTQYCRSILFNQSDSAMIETIQAPLCTAAHCHLFFYASIFECTLSIDFGWMLQMQTICHQQFSGFNVMKWSINIVGLDRANTFSFMLFPSPICVHNK